MSFFLVDGEGIILYAILFIFFYNFLIFIVLCLFFRDGN